MLLELVIRETHLDLVHLSQPESRAWRFSDDRFRHAELARGRDHFALEQTADGQQVDAAVAVLREVADRQFAAVSRPGDEIVERVCQEIERGHPQSRLDVRTRHLRPDVFRPVREVRKVALGQRQDRLPEDLRQMIVG